jgi:hypothetical protein
MHTLDNFLTELRQLTFCTVETVLKRRDDLIGFRTTDGRWTTPRDPWFGDAYATLGEEGRARTEMRYRYYCGHADDVFYRKPTRSDKRLCFMPALPAYLERQTPPVVGEIIFGSVDENGPEGRRFFWWTFATKQDRNFAGLLSGNLEKKLVIFTPRQNWTLFLLAKALHFRDVGYFADTLREHGEYPPHLCLSVPLLEWLVRCDVPLLAPEFWKELHATIP